VYTSGVSWHANHLGPGVFLATGWMLAALARAWPALVAAGSRGLRVARGAAVAATMVLVVGGLGLIRDPRNPVPGDFGRYVRDIEREFEGLDPRRVLLDTGSWIYLRHGVVMKDRSAAVSVHVGMNQPDIDRERLHATIARMEARAYDKILARQIDTDLSWYDFQDRGSGVKEAMLRNYRIVRRIPAVRGVSTWWPVHLVSEVVVLEPDPATALPTR
jgi:hypothetical protein